MVRKKDMILNCSNFPVHKGVKPSPIFTVCHSQRDLDGYFFLSSAGSLYLSQFGK